MHKYNGLTLGTNVGQPVINQGPSVVAPVAVPGRPQPAPPAGRPGGGFVAPGVRPRTQADLERDCTRPFTGNPLTRSAEITTREAACQALAKLRGQQQQPVQQQLLPIQQGPQVTQQPVAINQGQQVVQTPQGPQLVPIQQGPQLIQTPQGPQLIQTPQGPQIIQTPQVVPPPTYVQQPPYVPVTQVPPQQPPYIQVPPVIVPPQVPQQPQVPVRIVTPPGEQPVLTRPQLQQPRRQQPAVQHPQRPSVVPGQLLAQPFQTQPVAPQSAMAQRQFTDQPLIIQQTAPQMQQLPQQPAAQDCRCAPGYNPLGVKTPPMFRHPGPVMNVFA